VIAAVLFQNPPPFCWNTPDDDVECGSTLLQTTGFSQVVEA
jgi:hypothetical protein